MGDGFCVEQNQEEKGVFLSSEILAKRNTPIPVRTILLSFLITFWFLSVTRQVSESSEPIACSLCREWRSLATSFLLSKKAEKWEEVQFTSRHFILARLSPPPEYTTGMGGRQTD